MPLGASTPIAKFLSGLAEDPVFAQDFKTNPLGTMNKAGLTESEQHVVLSGNAAKIGALVGGIMARDDDGNNNNSPTVVVVVVAAVV